MGNCVLGISKEGWLPPFKAKGQHHDLTHWPLNPPVFISRSGYAVLVPYSSTEVFSQMVFPRFIITVAIIFILLLKILSDISGLDFSANFNK